MSRMLHMGVRQLGQRALGCVKILKSPCPSCSSFTRNALHAALLRMCACARKFVTFENVCLCEEVREAPTTQDRVAAVKSHLEQIIVFINTAPETNNGCSFSHLKQVSIFTNTNNCFINTLFFLVFIKTII